MVSNKGFFDDEKRRLHSPSLIVNFTIDPRFFSIAIFLHFSVFFFQFKDKRPFFQEIKKKMIFFECSYTVFWLCRHGEQWTPFFFKYSRSSHSFSLCRTHVESFRLAGFFGNSLVLTICKKKKKLGKFDNFRIFEYWNFGAILD